MKPVLLPPRVCVSRKLEAGTELLLEPMHSEKIYREEERQIFHSMLHSSSEYNGQYCADPKLGGKEQPVNKLIVHMGILVLQETDELI